MKRATLIALTAILIGAYSAGAHADEECVYTDPEGSSPKDVLDGAVYWNFLGLYRLYWPPFSELSYSAESIEEDPYPCLLAAAGIYLHPYALIPEVNSPIQIDIISAARRSTIWLPWPCEAIGVCVSFAASVVAAIPPDLNDLDVAYYFARYTFVTIVFS